MLKREPAVANRVGSGGWLGDNIIVCFSNMQSNHHAD
jgi:hypothetical protein